MATASISKSALFRAGFSVRKDQTPSFRQFGDGTSAVEILGLSDSKSALDSLPDVEPAGEILSTPTDNDRNPTPQFQIDTNDIRGTQAVANN